MEQGADHKSLNKFYLVRSVALRREIAIPPRIRLRVESGKAMAEFVGSAHALSSNGLLHAASEIGVGAAEIWTVLATEAGACGYLKDRRPCILYERHVFWRLTDGGFSDPDVSSSEPGGYKGGAAEYERLKKAMKLDRSAALKSASWGLGQILGENFAISGFGAVEDMVAAMMESEDSQLLAFASYLKSRNLDKVLRIKNWQAFAAEYNGPSYSRNRYDEKLKVNYGRYSTGSLPDLDVRGAQLYLAYLGFEIATIDGVMGNNTASALSKFQQSFGLRVTGKVDTATLMALKANASA